MDTGLNHYNGTRTVKKVAAVAGLKLKPTETGMTVKLDGRLNLDVTFNDKTMHPSAYIKMNAHDDLLSEEVCSQLDIVPYHSQVDSNQSNTTVDKPTLSPHSTHISLVDSV